MNRSITRVAALVISLSLFSFPAAPQPAMRVPAKGGFIAGTALDMKFTALDGRAVDMTKLRGKIVLVDLWATWCVPCMAELPNVRAVYDKYRQRGFEVIGINFDDAEAREKVVDLVKTKHYSWPQRCDGEMFDQKAGARYAIQGLPASFLIDKAGRLVEIGVKGSALEAAVLEYL